MPKKEEFWLGSPVLDRHVLLAVHGLGESGITNITKRTGELLVTTGFVNPKVQTLPTSEWVQTSIDRLIAGGYAKRLDSGLVAPSKSITEGWP
jgi:hypothetical protein